MWGHAGVQYRHAPTFETEKHSKNSRIMQHGQHGFVVNFYSVEAVQCYTNSVLAKLIKDSASLF